MKRTEKYPDHEHFTFYNANPHNRITTDCVIRALSTALEIPYNQVVMDMAELQCKTGFDPSTPKTYTRYLEKHGWMKCPQLKHIDGTKLTVREFVDSHPTGTYLLNMSKHLSVCKNGKILDIWDCYKHGRCVGNYYVKER